MSSDPSYAGIAFRGSLFSTDFLHDSIRSLPDWGAISDAQLDALRRDLAAIFAAFPTSQTPNESQTEDDLIWSVLARLGWTTSLRQQNLAARGRDDVPDGLLFPDDAAKAHANGFAQEWKRYEFGVAIVESKRWRRPLDRRSGRRGEETAPSTQMLRYLRRVEDLTTGRLRWGMLTNGAKWRLYWQGAQSVSEEFFEVDLAGILGLETDDPDLFDLGRADRAHWLRVFALVFRRESFSGSADSALTFHQRALEEGQFYEQRVAANLSALVFGQVFPNIVRAISSATPASPLQDVREAALILLYRLLFILYAEDRDLLPVRDRRYDDYGLRDRVRMDVGRRKDNHDTFSDTAARYWAVLEDLCRAIDGGDRSIGLPPYNGGLFDPRRTPLLSGIRLDDQVMSDLIDALSFERTATGRKYINYRDLNVRQLGSIYERLLEHEVVREADQVEIRPNPFARKGSGSYYTPDDLVSLIVRETVEPFVETRMAAFLAKAEEVEASGLSEDRRLGSLKRLDPAEKMLELRICDPAMGSGHFLVSLVDYLADNVIRLMAESEAAVSWGEYVSPLGERIDNIRNTILGNAEERGWTIDPAQLDDRHIVRRMVLKRCIYGVDKNLMAVELAKVALWLHTFTVGAPLSFLDHHLRCGDSLFGSWVAPGVDRAAAYGLPLLLHDPVTRAMRAASKMQIIESLTDAEIAEAHRSKDIFDDIKESTAPLNAFLALVHAFDWLERKSREDRAAFRAFFDGRFGDPLEIALGKSLKNAGGDDGVRFAEILRLAQDLIREENFLNWQVAFPGVWTDWSGPDLEGGFDAIVGNPPWDRMKLQQVEWFAARRPEIALAQRASDRAIMIAGLERAEDPLAIDFRRAEARAAMAVRQARDGGDYPLLSGGDINLYSLFVERAMHLLKPDGVMGLLTPSGIASDKTAAPFFKSIAVTGRLRVLYDFENRRTRYETQPFFPDVDSRFKFCVLIVGRTPTEAPADCAFFLQDVSELGDPERRFPLTPEDFARVNPNTGTAPIFRTRRDAALTTLVYARLPALVDRSGGVEARAWPVRYSTMFHMTNDSGEFRTRRELEETEAAYPIDGGRFQSASGAWLPLYEGKMAQAFDHRAASVVLNPQNQHRPAQPEPATLGQHQDPDWQPTPQFWVRAESCGWKSNEGWVLGFKEITAPTNTRTFIAALFPLVGFGNKIPLLKREGSERDEWLLAANFNSIVFDFVTRQKIQGQTLNLFIVEQLPVVPLENYRALKIGLKTAEDIAREIVVELTYTSHDMAPFARDMGYINEDGTVKPPFPWEERRRLELRAKLDALFFLLFSITDRGDIRYIYSTFPSVQADEEAEYARFLSRDLCLAWLNAFAAGDPDAAIRV